MKFIIGRAKKIQYGLLVLIAISSTDVHCSSYADYVKNSLPYAAALAFIAANYYRRNSTQLSNSYDALSYAAPVVAVGAGSLLAQPGNWQGAFVRTLPVIMFALGALGLEKATAQTQSSSFNKSPAHMRWRFLSQKDDFYKIKKQYELVEKTIEDAISNIFKENNSELSANLAVTYGQLREIREKLAVKYALLQSLADQMLKNNEDEPPQNLSVRADVLSAAQKVLDNVDPALTVAKSFYANAIINKHYMLLKQRTIDPVFVRKLMNDVMDIQQFFGQYAITLPYTISSLQKNILNDLTKQLINFKKFDQEVQESVSHFLKLLHESNDYLKHNKVDDFRNKIAEIKQYYNDATIVYNKYQQAIQDMSIRVGHMIKEYPERGIINIYNDIISMLQLSWKGCIIALLQNHYITRKGGKDIYRTYFDVINRAQKDNFITKEQYRQLKKFIVNIQPNSLWENRIIEWRKEIAAF